MGYQPGFTHLLVDKTNRGALDSSEKIFTSRPQHEPQSKPGEMKVSKGQSQPEIAADIHLLDS